MKKEFIEISPPNTLLCIDEMYVFISKDEKGNEGICGFLDTFSMTWVPLIAADVERLDSIRFKAKEIATNTKKEIRLIKLSTRTELEVIKP